MADAQSTQDTCPVTSQDSVVAMNTDRKRKQRHSTEPEAKLTKQTSHSKVLLKNKSLAKQIIDVEEVCTRLSAQGVFSLDTCEIIKNFLSMENGLDLAANTLQECLAQDIRQSSFFLFLDVLETTKQGFLADLYRKAYLEDIKVELQKMYKANYSTVLRKPWIEDDAMEIDSIFINLELLQRGEFTKSEKSKQYKNYGDIFSDPKFVQISRCVICGVAGSGKSTLSHKIVFDWANGKLQNFFLVLLVPVREITAEEGISQKLKAMYRDVYFKELLKLKKDSVLLILDGLDELQENVDRSELIEILKGQEFLDFSMLLTTRPHGLGLLKGFHPLKLNIKGFSQKDVEKYIKRYFKNANPTKATKVIKKCANTNNLWSLMENPLCCLLVCFLYENRYAEKHVDYEMPDKKTELYREVIEVFQEIYDQKHGKVSWEGKILNMGKLAFDKLLTKKHGVLIFADDALAKYNIESAYACNLGILSRIESSKARETCTSKSAVSWSKTIFYSFIHKSMQEFTAAMYVHQAEPTTAQNILQTLQCSIKTLSDLASLELFLYFVCGLDKGSEKGGSIFFLAEIFVMCCDLLKQTNTQQHKYNIVNILVNLCLESKSDILQCLPKNGRVQFVKIAYKAGYHEYAKNNYTRFARALGVLNTPEIQRVMGEIVILDPEKLFVNKRILLSEEDLSRIACFLNTFDIRLTAYHLESLPAMYLTCSVSLRTIQLVDCHFKDTHSVGEYLMCVSHWPNLVSFQLVCPIIPKTKSQGKFCDIKPVPSPVGISKLQSLEVSQCTNVDCFIPLTQLLETLNRLEKLVLKGNTFGNTLEALANAIPLSVQEIDLGNTILGDSGLDHIALQLPRLKHLFKVLWCNIKVARCGHSDSFSLHIGEYTPDIILLKYCESIKELNVSKLKLDENMQHLLLALPISIGFVNMKGCCLNGNLSELVRRWENLEKLDMSNATLTDDLALVELINALPNSLQWISLCRVQLTNPAVISISKRLLCIQNCELCCDGLILSNTHCQIYTAKVNLVQCHEISRLLLQQMHQVDTLFVDLWCAENETEEICQIDSLLDSIPSTVKGISVSSVKLTDQITKAVEMHLKLWTNIQQLVLGSPSHSSTIVNRPSLMIPLLPASLEVLNFEGISLSNNNSKCLIQQLPSFQWLRELNLSDISLSHLGSEVKLPLSLEKLNLSDCHMGDKCVTAVLKQVAKLTNLNLAYNSLKQATWIPIASDITELNLHCCDLTKVCVEDLLKKLPSMNRLTDVNIGDNNFESVDSNLLSLFPISLLNLDMSNCALTAESVKTLLRSLPKWTELKKLNLSRNKLSAPEWCEVCGVLEKLENLRNEVVVSVWNTGIAGKVKKELAKDAKNITWHFE